MIGCDNRSQKHEPESQGEFLYVLDVNSWLERFPSPAEALWLCSNQQRLGAEHRQPYTWPKLKSYPRSPEQLGKDTEQSICSQYCSNPGKDRIKKKTEFDDERNVVNLLPGK